MVRLSVRYLDRGQPTDVIGRVVSRDPLVLERRDGSRATIHRGSVLALREVTDRPVRTRPAAAWHPDEVQRVCSHGWPAAEQEPCGNWTLRSTSGWTKRANSALAVGEPSSLAEVESFYRERGLPALVQVVSGTSWDERLRRLGWRQIGPITRLLVKDLTQVSERAAEQVALAPTPDRQWLDLFGQDGDAAVDLLTGPTARFCTIDEAAIARVAVTGEWAGLSCVQVLPSHRRRGLATELLRRCEAWSSTLADKAYVQVTDDEILGLYREYSHHHDYVYLSAPEASGA